MGVLLLVLVIKCGVAPTLHAAADSVQEVGGTTFAEHLGGGSADVLGHKCRQLVAVGAVVVVILYKLAGGLVEGGAAWCWLRLSHVLHVHNAGALVDGVGVVCVANNAGGYILPCPVGLHSSVVLEADADHLCNFVVLCGSLVDLCGGRAVVL